jgi:hypothetical protein
VQEFVYLVLRDIYLAINNYFSDTLLKDGDMNCDYFVGIGSVSNLENLITPYVFSVILTF